MNHSHHPFQRRIGAWLVLMVAITGWSPVASQAVGSLTVRLVPQAQPRLHQPVQLALVVDNAPNIGGYEALLSYDDQRAHVRGVQPRPSDLTGRDVSPLGPVFVADGVTFGAASCARAQCGERHTQSLPAAPSVAGTLQLATITLVPDMPGQQTVSLAAITLVDPQGMPLAVDVRNVALTFDVVDTGTQSMPVPADEFDSPRPMRRTPFPVNSVTATTDVTNDGRTDAADFAVLTAAWTSAREQGALCGTPSDVKFDIHTDGCFDVADLQQVAAHSVATALAPTGLVPAASAPWIVNDNGDADDATPGDGVCATSAGVCTLRAAIREANRHTGPDTITFALPGSGVQTIQLAASLPPLSDTSGGTTIDGYTQPGAQPNTDPRVSNAQLTVQIKGSGADTSVGAFDGLVVATAGNTLRGLSFSNLHRSVWVTGSAAQGNTIVGCFLGLDAAGNTPYGGNQPEEGKNNAYGINIDVGASGTLVGGSAPADRNIISGNARTAVYLSGEGTANTVIVNNIVGLSPNGAERRRNWGKAIDINRGVRRTRVGGTQTGERNVLSGNQGAGIEISHDSVAITADNVVIGNFIGSDVDGRGDKRDITANRTYGIDLHDGIANNTIGPGNIIVNNVKVGITVFAGTGLNNRITGNQIGVDVAGMAAGNGFGDETAGGEGILLKDLTQHMLVDHNTIAYNRGTGLYIAGTDSDANTATQNAFYSNGGLGIDLDPAGVNTAGMCPTNGPNQCVSAPSIAAVSPTTVRGTACPGCTVELYIADDGEGRTLLQAVQADASGQWSAPASVAAAGKSLTATATDAQGNTSEFAQSTPYVVYLPIVAR